MDINNNNNNNNNSNNDQLYIDGSKKNIDTFIHKKQYKQAFGLLILVLERLENNQKIEFIDYYSKNLSNFGFFQ
jgi:hypothetical protein